MSAAGSLPSNARPGQIAPIEHGPHLGEHDGRAVGQRQAIRCKVWAVGWWILVLAYALGATPEVIGQGPPRSIGASAASHAAQGRVTALTGVAIFRGLELEYEVVDGWAVHGGDIILGPVEDVEAEYERSRAMGKSAQDWPQRRDASTTTDEFLWPDATVPYEIDPGFNEQAVADIRQAINDWNTKTLITLVERTTEADFVRFRAEGRNCASPIGRLGGPQNIWLYGPDGCGVGTAVHEIGHSVGLLHEHQREDRDAYVMIPEATLLGRQGMWYRAVHPPDGPYDYASTMHYGGIETIPPGMPVPADRLSPGDIAAVARLYGRPLPTTTISTNPPGLEIEVDGQAVTTPATFHWSPGSEHVVEARSPQVVAGIRLVFARWTDGGSARHTVTAKPENPWFEASYVVQRSLLACADPSESGEANILPDSPDDYHTIRSPVGIEAVTSPGSPHVFREWSARDPRLWRRLEGRRGSFMPGPSSNPATGVIATGTSGVWKWRRSEYEAQFGAGPMFRIGSNVDGIRISVNGAPKSLPWAFPASLYPDGVTVAIPEETGWFGSEVRFRFGGWSDGGGNTHRVAVPPTGGGINAKFMPEYRLLTSVRNRWGEEDVISAAPPSEDGFYAADTPVQVTAAPSSDKHFAGWTGDVSGYDPVQLVVMESAKSIEAVFTYSQPLRPGEKKEMVLGASDRFEIYNSARGWNVLVPPGGSELTVRFQSSSTADVDLYVRRASEVRARPSEPDRKPLIDAHFESTTPGASEAITISRESTPRLENGVYFIALVAPPTSEPIRGTLSVSIRRSGIVRAWPAALTFVAAGAAHVSPPQTVQVTHAIDGPVRYRVESSRPWISAAPNEWVQTASGLAEVSIAVHGASLLPGTHWGKVTILRVDDPGAATGATPTGIELPVVLAVLSRNGYASRKANGVWITSSPVKGDTYGAGESVEVWVDLVAPVNIERKPTLALAIGNRIREIQSDQARSSHCEGGDLSLRFRYEVQEEDRDADGISISEYALGLNGGRIDTIDGVPSILSLAPIPSHPDHKVDGSKTVAPQVTNVWISSRPQDGIAYGAGERIEAGVGFSHLVEVRGNPTLTLAVGTEARRAALSSSNGQNLWFSYEVQAGDSDADGVSIPANALAFSGGSIRSPAGADARLDLGSHAIADNAEHKVDGSKAVAPQVTNVRISSRPQDGVAYGVGEEIEARVGFSHIVEVRGDPTLALAVGTEARRAALSSSNGQNLWFSYEVQAGDSDADGVSIPANALTLNGGSIRSPAGADAGLSLGSHAIADNAEHKVDGSKTVPPQVTRVEVYSRPQDGIAYGAGEQIRVSVELSQVVEVTGDPTLTLNLGTEARQAALSSSNGQNLDFRYEVRVGDADADGVSIPANALTLSGGSIRSPAGADARLDLGSHAIGNDAEHKVDGSKVAAPQVTWVRVYSRPQDGIAYGAGEQIRVSVELSQVVEVTGDPTLTLNLGTEARQAALSSSNGQNLWFSYEVQAGDADADGVSIAANALTLNGGSIRSPAGADARLDLGSHAVADDAEHKVDGSKTVPPQVTRVGVYSRPQDGIAYGAGEQIKVSVGLSHVVKVTGDPTLTLNLGTEARQAALSSSNGRNLNFRYEVRAGDADADGVSIPANALALNGGSIRSPAGADARLDLGSHAIADNAEHKVDGSKTVPPQVTRVGVYSRPQDGIAYGAGEQIKVSVGLSHVVKVTGDPTLTLNLGTEARQAALSSSNGRNLNFRYEVRAGDADADGVSIPANALALNGGSIRSPAGADARLDLGSHAIADNAEHKVDGSKTVPPQVTNVWFSSRPQDGVAYGVGEQIRVWVGFSHLVEVTGDPTLALAVGAEARQAALSSNSGRDLLFRYEVRAGDADADGVSIPANALALNGGSIRSPAGADARLDLGSHAIADNAEHKVDGSTAVAPQVTGVRISSRPRDGIAYGVGEQIDVWVGFSHAVQAAGRPTLALTVGTAITFATLVGRGDQILVFRYEVQARDSDADGVSIPADALTLNGGSIRSPAGADARLDLGSHAISDDAEHKVDGSTAVAPEVTGVQISSRPQDGIAYGVGEQIEVRVGFNQVVQLTGRPSLALTVGTAIRQVAVSSNNERNLWFRYEVQAEDADADGVSIGANALTVNFGSILGPAGSDALLDLGSHAISDDAEHKVDGSKTVAPEVTGVRIYSRPQDGIAYGVGEQIRVSVRFSHVVRVRGRPALALTVGTTTRPVSLLSSNRRTLFFRYTVRPGDLDPDGISIPASALTLNRGSVRSVAGPDAALELGAHAIVNDPEHKVDGGG